MSWHEYDCYPHQSRPKDVPPLWVNVYSTLKAKRTRPAPPRPVPGCGTFKDLNDKLFSASPLNSVTARNSVPSLNGGIVSCVMKLFFIICAYCMMSEKQKSIMLLVSTLAFCSLEKLKTDLITMLLIAEGQYFRIDTSPFLSVWSFPL